MPAVSSQQLKATSVPSAPTAPSDLEVLHFAMVVITVTTKEQLYWTPQSSVLLAIIVRVGLLLLHPMVFSAP